MEIREITYDKDELEEPDITWGVWFTVFVCGFVAGATLDLFSLYLFAKWFH